MQQQHKNTTESNNVDKEIKVITTRLKELIAYKKGITVEELNFKNKEKEKKKINNSRFRDITFKFQCPDCQQYNTKRNGTTTQIETKARFLCYDCQYQRQITKDKTITPFFVLSNDEMKEEIDSNKGINEEQRKMFYEKYLIKLRRV